jgi:hypothetical protein
MLMIILNTNKADRVAANTVKNVVMG